MRLLKKSAGFTLIIHVVIAVSLIGGYFTSRGMDWYRTLTLPAFTPPGSTIGMVWTVIYILSAVSACLIWHHRQAIPHYRLVGILLILNAVLNALWTLVFFTWHLLGWAIVEMVLLNLTTLAVIVLTWRHQRLAAALLLPYFAWVCFATYLAWTIWRLNG